MGNPLRIFFKSPSAQARFLRVRVVLAGLAMDFWKDTPIKWSSSEKKQAHPKAVKSQKKNEKEIPSGPKIWIGDRIQIMERMWGEGHAFPGGDSYIDMLITPLGITKEMSLIDLSAKLGSMARKIAEDFGAYVTGMEMDPALVSRGMILSIAAGKGKQASVESYNPESYAPKRKYDCLFARDLFYRIEGKDAFLKAVGESIKPGGGQIVFTDYLLDPASRGNPALVEWMAKEGGVMPLSLPETLKNWKDLGFDMRVAEDQTDLYCRAILDGFVSLLSSLSECTPDKGTKILLLKEIDLWAQRFSAFKQGLKYYRFYGIKYKKL